MSNNKLVGGLLVAAVCAFPGCGGGGGGESPNDAFDKLTAAVEAKDWEAAFSHATAETQARFAGALIFGIQYDLGFGAGVENDAMRESFHEIIESHGIDADSISIDAVRGSSPSEVNSALESIAAPASDKPALIAELMDWLEENLPEAATATARELGGELKGLETNGDKATATLVTTINGEQRERAIEFHQVDGAWFMHLPPPERPED